MVSDPEREKLEQLAARIRQAKGVAEPAASSSEGTAEAMKASRIGFDFVATVCICAVVGWLIDRWLGVKPWGLIVMILVGFIAGIMNVWRALGGYDQAVGWHKRDDDK